VLPSQSTEVSESTDGRAEPAGRWIAGLSPQMPLLEALELVFRQRYDGVLYYLPLAAERAGENIEYVHKLRVSCRRLAAVLDVLAEGLPETPRRSLLKLLDKIRATCGKARDLDVRRVFLESQLRMASVEDAGVVELLCEKTVWQRERAQRNVRRRLEKLEVQLHEAGDELLSALHSVQRDAAAAYETFGKTGCRILARELAALWDLSAKDIESTATLHQLRLACKHLRYAFEVFVPVLPESFRQEFYPQLERTQQLLGEFHDAAEATRDLNKVRKKWKRARGTKKWPRQGLSGFRWRELRSGFSTILLAYAQQSDHARTEFLDHWPAFAGPSFREPVADLLAELMDSSVAPAVTPPGSGEQNEHLLPH
jgi:CHAD domain-containing protein